MNTPYDALLQLVTDDRLPPDRIRDVVAKSVPHGVGVVQLRMKAASAREMLAALRLIEPVTRGAAKLIVNDRLDVALAARDAGLTIDGVHLGQSDVPPETARRLLGPDALIGWTADTPEHLAAAHEMPAGTVDVLGVGAIRPTSTKPDHPEPLGMNGFRAFAAASRIPCIAIGGVDADNAGDLIRAGAVGIAVVSTICGAPDPARATQRLMDAMSGARDTRTGADE